MNDQTKPVPQNSDSVLVPRSDQKPEKFKRLKKFLLTFFIIEHIVILLILLIPTIFLIRAYAFSDFGKLNENAKNFTPQNKEIVTAKYAQKYQDYLKDFLDPEVENPSFEVGIEQNDINTYLSDINVDQIEKIYLEIHDENTVYIWVKPTQIPYPLMFKVNFLYDYPEEKFEVEILDWQVGPLSFPASILGFVEENLNKDSFASISSITNPYYSHIDKLETSEGNVNVTLRVDDKVAFLKKLFESSSKQE